MRATETEYLLDEPACHARAERSDPSVMCCPCCGLFWDVGDPTPPGCRAARRDDELATDGCTRVRGGVTTTLTLSLPG